MHACSYKAETNLLYHRYHAPHPEAATALFAAWIFFFFSCFAFVSNSFCSRFAFSSGVSLSSLFFLPLLAFFFLFLGFFPDESDDDESESELFFFLFLLLFFAFFFPEFFFFSSYPKLMVSDALVQHIYDMT